MVRANGSRGSAPACVEVLECRRLLSASAALFVADALAARAATTVHNTIPVLTGAPFVGTAATTDGTVYDLTIDIATQRRGGGVTGSFTIAAGGQTLTYTFSGSVNRRGTVVLHAHSGGHRNATVTGTAGADGNSLAGTFVSSGRHNSSRGTFTTSRT